jgi:3-oxoacyl-[acyl-carrier protein] reductase
MILDKQIVVVTGASRGIGRSIALELARQGATVIGTATSESGADAISAALKEAGVQGRGAVLNVTDAAASEAFIDGVVKEFGGLNVLVNNAGITKDQLAMRMKDEEFDDESARRTNH